MSSSEEKASSIAESSTKRTSRLHFANAMDVESLDATLVKSFKTLSAFGQGPLSDFVETIFQFLESPKRFDIIEAMGSFSKKHNVKKMGILKDTLRGTLVFFRQALTKNLSSSQIRSDLIALGLKEDGVKIVMARWGARFGSLQASMVASTLQVHKLVDMEWKFGVTAATDEMETIGTTFLQLKLVISKGSSTEDVYMELTLPQFYDFLAQLEKVNSLVDLMKA